MIRALWTAATGMEAQQLDQDVVAHNLANVNTVGFKASRADFQDLMYQVYTLAGAETTEGNALPAGLEIGMGVKPVATQRSFSQGDYQYTGNTFDFALEGDGFFQVDDNGTTYYTRAGNFRLDRDGYLCNPEGLRVIPEVVVPQDAVHFTVDKGGTWTATDGQGQILQTGRIELAHFINPAGLSGMGRNLYMPTEGSGEAVVDYPGENGMGTITQFFVEMSNVSVIEEMIKMIVGQRAYEFNSKAIQTADGMLQIISNLKR